MLLYEYATSIEKITNGKITAKFVIDKINNNMGILRYGDWKKGDEKVTYVIEDEKRKLKNVPVTSEEYKESCRIKNKLGAHAPTYLEGNNQKVAIVLFDQKQKYKKQKKPGINLRNIFDFKYSGFQGLSGINLNDLSDIRHTMFHEWTHIMEKCMVNTKDLNKEDIIFTSGSSTYINAMVDIDASIDKFEEYIENVDDLLNSNTDIIFGGISTVEINKIRKPKERIMHNQISEGSTELISRLVMEVVGDKVKHPERYINQVSIIRRIFENIGMDDAVTQYFTNSRELIKNLENKHFGGKDLLHYFDEHVTCLGDVNRTLKSELRRRIKDEGKVKKEVKNIRKKNKEILEIKF